MNAELKPAMNQKTLSRAEALKWVAEVFQHPFELAATTPRSEIPAWDSLGMLSLMARLDEDFSILLEPDDSDAMQSVADVLAILERNGILA